MPQVRIGPSFFAKAKNDYADWRWAFAREAMQNCLDAPGADRVEVSIHLAEGNTHVTFANNGAPMTPDVLVGKLLSIGESGKNFDGGVGGFGKAKELLYFGWLGYQIHTGDMLVVGAGAEYDIHPLQHLAGTSSTVLMQGDEVETLLGAFRRFAQLSQWPGTVVVNGEEFRPRLRKGHPRREFEWGDVYTNRQHERLVVVRIGGTTMFTRRTEFKGCVVVELKGTSGERLTSNRDGLLWQFREELDAFLLQLAVDKRSALKQRRAEIKRYEGERLKNEAKQPRAVAMVAELFADEDEGSPERLAAFVAGGDREFQTAGMKTEVVSRETVAAVSIGPEFFLKNTTGMVTPDYYTPGPLFSDYSRKLALAWAKAVLELHRLFDRSGEFSIGFVLDDDCAAEFSKGGTDGTVYYINPAVLVSQKAKEQCRSFRRRFTGAWSDRFEILALACHEFVHGEGYDQHDENYSSRLTEVTGKVMANLGRFAPLFR